MDDAWGDGHLPVRSASPVSCSYGLTNVDNLSHNLCPTRDVTQEDTYVVSELFPEIRLSWDLLRAGRQVGCENQSANVL